MHPFIHFLQSNDPIILAGAMGTELQRRGYKTELPLWSSGANLDAPELVKSIHRDYIAAGAEIITTNTFRTQRHTFQKVGNRELSFEATRNAVEVALEAKKEAEHEVFVGGVLAPLEDCYEPERVPEDSVLENDHTYQAHLLADLGVDFIFCETVNTIREAKVMAEAAQKTGLPFFISFVTNPHGNLLGGDSLKQAISVIRKHHVTAILLNCRPIDVIREGVEILLKEYEGIKGVYPNGEGKPSDDLGWEFTVRGDLLQKFVDHAKKWNERGIKILGGCCGTTPEYIQALKRQLTVNN